MTAPLIPASKVAELDPLERRLYDGVAIYCCTSDVGAVVDHPGGSTWRVGMVDDGYGFRPAEADDTACPECGTPGKQVSEVRCR